MRLTVLVFFIFFIIKQAQIKDATTTQARATALLPPTNPAITIKWLDSWTLFVCVGGILVEEMLQIKILAPTQNSLILND